MVIRKSLLPCLRLSWLARVIIYMPPTYCEKCHVQIDDDLKNSNDKKSCTKCGSTQRGLRVKKNENIRVNYHFGLLAERNGKIVAIHLNQADPINYNGPPYSIP